MITLKNIIFHQFQRYKTAQILLDSMRRKKSHTILEVGSGSHGNLGKFLPNDLITYLDEVLSPEALAKKKFVLGDATKLEYEDQSFDFVIALDVLEHIPPEKRQAFLHSITRVSKIGLIMTYPASNPENICNEQILDGVYHMVGTKTPPWVYEHRNCTLPDTEEILTLLAGLVPAENIFTMYQMNRHLFFRLLILEALASANNGISQIFHAMSNAYNDSIFYSDFEEDEKIASKTCLVWCRENRELKSVKKIDAIHPDVTDMNQFSQKLDAILHFSELLLKSKDAEGSLEQKNYTKSLQTAYINLKDGYDRLSGWFTRATEDEGNIRTAYLNLKDSVDQQQNQYNTLESYTKDLQNAYTQLKDEYDRLHALYEADIEEKAITTKALEKSQQFEHKVKATKWWKYLGSKSK